MELSEARLNAALPHLLQAPKDNAVIETLCFRPAAGQRRIVSALTLDENKGVIGDHMSLGASLPDPKFHVCMLPKRMLDLVWTDRATQIHPGDNIVADMDMSLANLAIGSRLLIGQAELEVSDEYNGGCQKWVARYGNTSFRWINKKEHQPLRLRGILCRIVQGGTITQTDTIRKAIG